MRHAGDRERMVARDIAGRGIRDKHLLEAMGRVPREEFVPDRLRNAAYEDMPLPIGSGQTISQPYIVAVTIEAARIGPGARVLDIGTGSGYAAAVLAEIADGVVTIERHADLADTARERLERLGYDNVTVVTGDGTLGYPDAAPYDAILAAAAGADVPPAWAEQLTDDGRIVMPVEYPDGTQDLVRLTRAEDGTLVRESFGGVRFVPLISDS